MGRLFMENNDYYVYVYIDPRNFEEFYYGKGKGKRKFAHLKSNDNSEKSKRVKEILSLNLNPIIKVIASGLTEKEALLIESTLIWKLGKFTTNIVAGHFKDKFRPHNTLHKDLPNFDYTNGIFYYNIGEGKHRCWQDFKNYSFISAGQGPKWRDQMINFNCGDIFFAYLKGHGFVGIGKIIGEASPINEIIIDGKSLRDFELFQPNIFENSNDYENSEYVCVVEWIATKDKEKAIWKPNFGLYTTTHVRASLENQQFTIDYISDQFGVEMRYYKK